MAESYRGLTIRIGGDTTGLSRALRSANSVANQTQSEFRKISQAAKLDPGNLEAFNLQLGYVSQKATAAAMKLHELKRAQEELKDQQITIGYELNEEGGLDAVTDSLKSIVQEARNAEGLIEGEVLNVAKLKAISDEALRSSTKSLGSAHNEVTKIVGFAAKMEHMKLSDAFRLSAGLTDADKLIKKYEKLKDVTGHTFDDKTISGFLASVKEMSAGISAAFNMETGKFDKAELKGVIEDFVKNLPAGVNMSKQAINGLIKSVEDYGAAHAKESKKASAATKEEVEQVRQLRAERDKLQSEIEGIDSNISSIKSSAEKEAQDEVNAATERGSQLVESVKAKNEENAKAIERSRKATEELAKAEADLNAGTEKQKELLEEADHLRNELTNAKMRENTDIEFNVPELGNNAYDAMYKVDDVYKDMYMVSSLLRAQGGIFDEEEAKEMAEALVKSTRLQDEYKSSFEETSRALDETNKKAREARLNGDDKIYEQLTAQAKEYATKQASLYAQMSDEFARGEELKRKESERTAYRLLDNAKMARKAFEQYFLQTGNTYSQEADIGILDSINDEIEASNNLMEVYKNKFGSTIKELRKQLRVAEKEGWDDVAAQIRGQIDTLTKTRDAVKQEMKRNIARLETEAGSVEELMFKQVDLNYDYGEHAYGKNPIVQIYAEIDKRIKESNASIDESKKKIAELRKQESYKGELGYKIEEETENIERQVELIKKYKADLASMNKAFSGKNLTEALKTANADYVEDTRKAAEETAKIHAAHVDEITQLDEAYRAKQEEADENRLRVNTELNPRVEAAKEAVKAAKAEESVVESVADAEAKAAEMKASAEESASARIAEVDKKVTAEKEKRAEKAKQLAEVESKLANASDAVEVNEEIERNKELRAERQKLLEQQQKLNDKIDNGIAEAEAEAQEVYNAAVKQGEQIVQEATESLNDKAGAAEAARKADEALAEAEAALNAEREENVRLTNAAAAAAQNLEDVTTDVNDNELEQINNALEEMSTNAKKAAEQVESISGKTAYKLASENMVTGGDVVHDAIHELDAQIDTLEKAYRKLFDESVSLEKKANAAKKSSDKEYYEGLMAQIDELHEKEVKLSDELRQAQIKRHALYQLEVEGSDGGSDTHLYGATQLRKAYEKYFMQTGKLQLPGVEGTLSSAIENEIDVAKKNLDLYRKYFKEAIASNKKELSQIDVEDRDVGIEITARIYDLEQSRNEFSKQATSQIAKLKTELEYLKKVQAVIYDSEGNQRYENTAPVKVYEEINNKLEEARRLRAEEKKSVADTTTILSHSGKTQEEINAATAEGVAKVEQYDKTIKSLMADLRVLSGGKGAYFSQAFDASHTEYLEDIKAAEKTRADVHEANVNRIKAADEELTAAQNAQAASSVRLAAREKEASDAKAEADLRRKTAAGDTTAIELAQQKAAEMAADAQKKGAYIVAKAVEEQASSKEELIEVNRRLAKTEDEIVKSTKGDLKAYASTFNENFGNLVGDVFNSKNGNTDPEQIRVVLQSVARDAGLSDEQIKKLYNDIDRLTESFREADTDVKKWKTVMQFEDLIAEAIKGEAQVKDFAKVLSSLEVPSQLTKGMGELITNSKYLDAVYKKITSTAGSIEAAYKYDPTNVSALTQAMNAYSAAEMVAVQNASLLEEQLERFEADGIEVDSSRFAGMSQELYEASKNAELAHEKFNLLEGELAETQVRMENLRNTRGVSVTDDGEIQAKRAKDVAEYTRLLEKVGELEVALGQARQAERDAVSTLEIAKKENEYVELAMRVDAYRKTIDEAYDAQLRLAKQSVVASVVVDMPEIESLDKQIEATLNRAKALMGEHALDPKNIELSTEKTRAFAEVEMLAYQRTELIKNALNDIDASKVDEMRGKYGTVANAVDKTTKQTKEYKQQVDDTTAELARLVSASEFDDIRDEVMDVGMALEQSVVDKLGDSIDEAVRLRSEISRLGDALRESMSEMGDATLASTYEKLFDKLSKNASFDKVISEAYDKQLNLTKKTIVLDAFVDMPEIDSLGKQLEAASNRAKALNEALELDPKNVELAAAKAQAFADVELLASRRAELIKKEMDKVDPSKVDDLRKKYGTVANAVEQTTKVTKKYQQEIDDATSSLAKLVSTSDFDEIRADVMSVGAALEQNVIDKLGESADEAIRLRTVIDRVGEALKASLSEMGSASIASAYEGLSGKLAKNGTLSNLKAKNDTDAAAFVQVAQEIGQWAEQAGRKVVESANTIDAAYRDMRKTVDGTEEEFRELRDSALAFSQTHITSADTILEMQALGGQLGITADALGEFGEVASNLDIATDISSEEIALQLGQITNVMHDLDYTTFDNFADALVRLGNNTAAQESSIMNVAQRMSSIANVAKFSSPQLLAWSAAIASTGQRSESAATAINNTIIGISEAVAKGGSDLENFAAIAGMASDDFVNDWGTDPSKVLEAFVKGLENLSESNTGAINALENMGISSIRQETALLGLASTIDNLDKAMDMAEKAFDGGGDAAREAAQKSEGFSGALGVLQNNVTNLAESLGDALIGPMKALSGILTVLTDVLNSLPGPLKSAVVLVGGLAAAVGVTAPIIKEFVEGWQKLAKSSTVLKVLEGAGGIFGKLNDVFGITAAKTAYMEARFGEVSATSAAASASLNGTTAAATGTSAAMGAAAAATNVLKAALTALPGVVVLTAIAKVAEVLVGEFNALTDRATLLNEAQLALADSAQLMGDAYKEATNFNATAANKSLKELREETNEAIEGFANFGNNLNEMFSGVGTDSAMVEHYASQLQELGNQGTITRSNLELLRNAVREYNDLTGASISIIDDQTGALSLNKDQINEVTKAYKERIEAQAYEEVYRRSVQERIELEREAAQAKKELTEAEETWGLRVGGYGILLGEQMDKYRELKSRSEAYEQELRRLNERIKDYEGHIGSASDATMGYESAMSTAGIEVEDFADLTDDEKAKLAQIQSALYAAGDSLANYGQLNVEQVKKMVAAWNGSVDDIVKVINRIKMAASSAPTIDYEADSKTLKKQLDDQYDARKDELDREYDLAKRESDREYDLQKDTLDKEYNERKRVLDQEYDDRKKVLDKEYDAQKDANDKTLKDFKRTQDKMVEAFKDATDERVKALKKEYDTKKKLLNDEYDKYDSQYDDAIEAIENQQKAEDAARKKAEQDAKTAELKDAVAKARTNKAKREAEEELKEHLEDIAYEQVEAQRDAAIDELKAKKEALKEQLEDREDTLKNSYDDAVDAYKEEREAKLRLLQESNELEYEEKKRLLDAELTATKDAQTAELESMKTSHEIELENLKSMHDSYLQSMKYAAEDSLYDMKVANEATLKSMKDNHEAMVESVKNGAMTMEQALNQGSQAVEGMTRSWADVPAKINEAVNTSVGSMSDLVSKAMGFTSTAAESTTNSTTKSFANIPTKVNEAVGLVGSTLADISAKTSSFTTGAVADTMASVAGSVNAGVESTAGSGESMANNVIGGIASVFNGPNGLPYIYQAMSKVFYNEDLNTLAADSGKATGGSYTSSVAANINSSDLIKGAIDWLLGLFGVDMTEALGKAGEAGGNAVDSKLAVGMTKDHKTSDTISKIIEVISKALGKSDWAKTSGSNLLINFINGISAQINPLKNVVYGVANLISSVLHHSVPDVGPLSDDDEWGYDFMQNFIDGINAQMRALATKTGAVAQVISDAMSGIDGGDFMSSFGSALTSDSNALMEQARRVALRAGASMEDQQVGKQFAAYMMQQAANEMRERQGELVTQAQMMARAIEEGFDPRLTIDAAYEAVDGIRAGQLRQMASLPQGNVDNSTYAPVININIPEVVVREEADIDRLSQQIALRVQRSLNARIG